MIEKLTVKEMVNDLKFEVICGSEYLDREITRMVLSRPGVEIYANYFDFYESDRIQILGTKENNLLNMVENSKKQSRVNKMFCKNTPAFIFTYNVEKVPNEFIVASSNYKIPILKSNYKTTATYVKVSSYLSEKLAEKLSVHGVMMDISGVGVLIRGKSSVGKSETALELLKRGYTLVSDDRVELIKSKEDEIVAQCPQMIERMMEVRGLGIVDVVELFGVKAFRNRKKLMLLVDLVKWDETVVVDRLGLEDTTEMYFDINIPKVVIHVQPGRNLASLVEVAAMNWRLKSYGHNSALDFIKKLDEERQRKNERKK